MDDTYTPDGALQNERFLDMSWLDTTVRNWCRQKGHEASLSGSVAIDVFRKRASVSAFRVAALCYYLYLLDEGGKVRGETRAKRLCKQIYSYMAEYILHGLLERWGRKFEELNAKRYAEVPVTRDPGIFALLSDDFTRDQLKALVKEKEMTTPARMFIYMWTQAGDIVSIDKDHFHKIKKL